MAYRILASSWDRQDNRNSRLHKTPLSGTVREMAVRIFISHSSLDTWVARQIGTRIETLGANVFLDEADVATGDNFVEQILTAEPNCTGLLALLTPWAIQRTWVLFEISCFLHSRKRIVGVMHGLTAEEALKDPYVGDLLDRHVLLDINRLDSYFRELGDRIKADAEGGSDGQAVSCVHFPCARQPRLGSRNRSATVADRTSRVGR